MASFLTINTAPLTTLSTKLGGITQARINQAEVGVVNEVTQRTYDKARATMIAGINLPDSYLRERMSVLPATDDANPTAYIRAAYRHTLLSRYAARQVFTTNVTGGRRLATRRAAGVTVEVTRGSQKTLPTGFLIPLKNGNGLGLFIRHKGAKKPTILYGPSVYQLFRASVEVIKDDVLRDLETTSIRTLGAIFDEALT